MSAAARVLDQLDRLIADAAALRDYVRQTPDDHLSPMATIRGQVSLAELRAALARIGRELRGERPPCRTLLAGRE